MNEQGDIILTNVDGSEPKVFLPGANITDVSTCSGSMKHYKTVEFSARFFINSLTLLLALSMIGQGRKDPLLFLPDFS